MWSDGDGARGLRGGISDYSLEQFKISSFYLKSDSLQTQQKWREVKPSNFEGHVCKEVLKSAQPYLVSNTAYLQPTIFYEGVMKHVDIFQVLHFLLQSGK